MRKNKIKKRWIRGEGGCVRVKERGRVWRFVEREKKIRG
jgi:hypothetical protein